MIKMNLREAKQELLEHGYRIHRLNECAGDGPRELPPPGFTYGDCGGFISIQQAEINRRNQEKSWKQFKNKLAKHAKTNKVLEDEFRAGLEDLGYNVVRSASDYSGLRYTLKGNITNDTTYTIYLNIEDDDLDIRGYNDSIIAIDGPDYKCKQRMLFSDSLKKGMPKEIYNWVVDVRKDIKSIANELKG